MFETEVGGRSLAESAIQVFQSVFKNTKPTWTSTTVKGLMDPKLYAEISVEALLP